MNQKQPPGPYPATLQRSEAFGPYQKIHGVWHCWPKTLGALAKEEAAYHDEFDENAIVVHQLDSWRNRYYHARIWQALCRLPKGSHILEVGAGSGYDAEQLRSQYELTLSDISPKTVERLRARLGDERCTYVAADGEHLPFIDEGFDGVYMVATLHHFHEPRHAFDEMARVLKPGGVLVIGIEPNAFYFRWIKYFRTLLCRATHSHAHEGSHADAEMSGFRYRDLKMLAADEQWQRVEVTPVWLFSGFLHYGLEFLFRLLRLKQRLGAPRWIEKAVVTLDEWLFRIPGVRHLGWHWTLIVQKK